MQRLSCLICVINTNFLFKILFVTTYHYGLGLSCAYNLSQEFQTFYPTHLSLGMVKGQFYPVLLDILHANTRHIRLSEFQLFILSVSSEVSVCAAVLQALETQD